MAEVFPPVIPYLIDLQVKSKEIVILKCWFTITCLFGHSVNQSNKSTNTY